jgi:hypothetical protein
MDWAREFIGPAKLGRIMLRPGDELKRAPTSSKLAAGVWHLMRRARAE